MSEPKLGHEYSDGLRQEWMAQGRDGGGRAGPGQEKGGEGGTDAVCRIEVCEGRGRNGAGVRSGIGAEGGGERSWRFRFQGSGFISRSWRRKVQQCDWDGKGEVLGLGREAFVGYGLIYGQELECLARYPMLFTLFVFHARSFTPWPSIVLNSHA